VGAGASKEAGLPTGAELTDIIAEKLNLTYGDAFMPSKTGDDQIEATLQDYARTHQLDYNNTLLPAALKIRNAMPQASSIDTFIDHNRQNPYIALCGKVSIVQSILEAERASSLNFDGRKGEQFDPSKLQHSWYIYLTILLFSSVYRDELDKVFKNVSFIVFNYDRCVEHYLYHTLQNYYDGVSPDEADSILQGLTILHPFGDVGGLPWRDVAFGSDRPNRNRIEMAEKIKTFTERGEDNEVLSAIKNEVREAQVIVFLGFGFDDRNIELISPGGESNTTGVRVFGTAKGLSNNDVGIVSNKIAAMLPRFKSEGIWSLSVSIRNLSCSELFGEFWRSLSWPPP